MPPRCEIEGPAPGQDAVVVRLSGIWRISNGVPSAEEVLGRLGADSGVRSITFDAAEVTEWDSGLLTFLGKILARCTDSGITVQDTGLPEGVRRLLKLALAVPAKETSRDDRKDGLLSRLGTKVIGGAGELLATVRLVGECLIAFGRMRVEDASAEVIVDHVHLAVRVGGEMGVPHLVVLSGKGDVDGLESPDVGGGFRCCGVVPPVDAVLPVGSAEHVNGARGMTADVGQGGLDYPWRGPGACVFGVHHP